MKRTNIILAGIAVTLIGLYFTINRSAPPIPPPALRLFEPLDSPATISVSNKLFIEEMTWVEVREAIKSGFTTALVATGGIEQSGPFLPTGKHNFILRKTTELIARKIGNTLVAPIVVYTPEGNITPPTGHMAYPGTISMRPETFEVVLTDICNSLKQNGFKNIILLGDSGDNQDGMKSVAERLAQQWRAEPAISGQNQPTINSAKQTKIHFIPEYYNYNEVREWLVKSGYPLKPEIIHDDLAFTAELLSIDPELVRMSERVAAGQAKINGIDLQPVEKFKALGDQIIASRVERTANAITQQLGSN